MLQNARITAFTVTELLRENQQVKLVPLTQIKELLRLEKIRAVSN